MKTLTNLAGSVATGDSIADAVVVYHDALVARELAVVIEIPVVGDDVPVRRASLAVGWLTQLVATPAPRAGRDVEDATTVNSLHAMALALPLSTFYARASYIVRRPPM